ncbi:MAG: DUF5615 family PIN-like protein [Pseudonocardiaceae bacterium]
MKFLLDSNLSHRVAQLLRDAGIDATRVRDNDLQHATDLTILMFARPKCSGPAAHSGTVVCAVAHLRIHDAGRAGRHSPWEHSQVAR